jgi:hypothetical protein
VWLYRFLHLPLSPSHPHFDQHPLSGRAHPSSIWVEYLASYQMLGLFWCWCAEWNGPRFSLNCVLARPHGATNDVGLWSPCVALGCTQERIGLWSARPRVLQGATGDSNAGHELRLSSWTCRAAAVGGLQSRRCPAFNGTNGGLHVGHERYGLDTARYFGACSHVEPPPLVG